MELWEGEQEEVAGGDAGATEEELGSAEGEDRGEVCGNPFFSEE